MALEPPPGVVDALDRWASESAAPDALRRVPAASLHMTLAFLGEMPEEEAEAIGEAVLACAAPVPGLSLGEAAWLPPRRPRVLAVDVADADGACAALQARVSAALVALGAYTPEARAFRPHITVARVRRGARVDHRQIPIAPPAEPFAGHALTLYRSRLGAGGARYEPLARAVLGPGGA